MLASLAPLHQAEASTNIADQCKTKLPPSPSQVADFFSQMACYIWFSNGHPLSSMPVTPSKSPNTAYVPLQSSPLAPRHGAHPYASRPQRTHTKHTSYGGPSHHPSYAASNDLSRAVEEHLRSLGKPRDPTLRRLQPRSRFLRFTRELLATTQVSNSVILLALIYIIRLKSGHPGLQGRDGSEFRLAVSSLMLANKILDDNTYLNKTWAEISGLPLIELGKAELEFWLGLKMRLHVTTDEYQAGLQELETLAEHRSQAVRERDASMRRAAQQQQANMAPYLSHQPSMSFPDILAQQHTVRRSLGNIHAHHFSPASMGTAFPSSPEGLRSAIPFHEPGAYPYATSPVAAQPHFHLPPPSPLSQIGPSNESFANFAGASDFAYSTPATSEHSINQLDGTSGLESTWQPTGIASAQLQPLSISHEPWGTTPPRTAHSASVQFDGSRSSHTSSSFSGLKRDFERTSLGAGSPVESSRTNKRFAAEPSAADDLHHYRISSSLSRQSHSPTDNRGAHRHYRHGSRERFQSMQHHRLSVSPTASRLSSVSYQASPLTALTPDFLAQPLDTIQHQRSGPLQYYSLAAGQPYGVIGSYMPPELPYQMQSMSAGYQLDRPIAGARRASNAGFTAAANAAASAAAAATNNGGGSAYSSSYNDSLLSSGRLQVPERPAIHQQPSAPAQLSAPPLGIASDAIKTDRYTVDNRQVPYNGTAPFVSDAHAWPLTHTSSNFLYPHHFAH
ncbi:hypothetical protein FA10DRAFT_141961 [Acaromyces ingoldii]|uniref:Cyclin-domain-containing protein n=1 Tax=Acaromyces ingoldii TaxID=215250 RepID=A0A316YJU0_9BASI|nr:hypothetical protein FA10DRAFT_141961 [Acaromyces ingoldii]PWN89336.1 hypothetical protein FA10DRAFT_141961 [Acaromyces ingoldii]